MNRAALESGVSTKQLTVRGPEQRWEGCPVARGAGAQRGRTLGQWFVYLKRGRAERGRQCPTSQTEPGTQNFDWRPTTCGTLQRASRRSEGQRWPVEASRGNLNVVTAFPQELPSSELKAPPSRAPVTTAPLLHRGALGWAGILSGADASSGHGGPGNKCSRGLWDMAALSSIVSIVPLPPPLPSWLP